MDAESGEDAMASRHARNDVNTKDWLDEADEMNSEADYCV